MGKADQTTEFDLASIVDKVRDDPNGPSERTRRVYAYLSKSDFTNWDVMCFAVEYIASMVGSLPWLEEPAKHLVRLLYMAHYFRFETISWMETKVRPGSEQER